MGRQIVGISISPTFETADDLVIEVRAMDTGKGTYKNFAIVFAYLNETEIYFAGSAIAKSGIVCYSCENWRRYRMNIEQTIEDSFQEVRVQPTARIIEEKKGVPPLESGDRLTLREFERRYHATPNIKKAELIEGVVYIQSPVRFERHGEPHAHIIGWLVTYCAATPGVRMADNTTVRLDPDNEVQPDALLRVEPAQGGNSRISDDDYIEGSPELVVEVAYTSAAYDLHDKLKVYRRNGVKEYVVWQTQDKRLDWFRLVEGEYVSLKPDASGVLHSEVFPGLRLAVTALLKGDLATVLSELQKGLDTDEHAAFVERPDSRPR